MAKEDKNIIIARIIKRVEFPASLSRVGIARSASGIYADATGLFAPSTKKDEDGDIVVSRIGKWEHLTRQGLERIDKVEEWTPYKIKSPLILLAECSDGEKDPSVLVG